MSLALAKREHHAKTIMCVFTSLVDELLTIDSLTNSVNKNEDKSNPNTKENKNT